MSESIKKESVALKILLGALAVVEAVGAVIFMVIAQVIAVWVFAKLGVAMGYDPSAFVDKFSGSSTFFYTVITIPVMFLYLLGIYFLNGYLTNTKITSKDISASLKGLLPCKETLFMNQRLNATTLVFVVVIAFGLMGIVTIYLVVADQIAQHFTQVAEAIEEYSESVDRFAQTTPEEIPVFDHILNFISVCFLVPITEELTFRAGVLQTLLRRFHPIIAVILSASIFGVLHVQPVHIGYAFIAGFFLGWVYFYTKSIRSTILIHILFNLFGSGINTLFQSGLFGDASYMEDEFNILSIKIEFLLMIPAIICFFLLRSMYKNSRKINTVVVSADTAAALQDTDSIEDFVPDENAPSPFAPAVKDDGEMSDEQT